MLSDFPGTVETSSNLASVKKSNELIEIKILTRSSSESRKEEICSSLESVFALAGAKVEYGGAYGGWQPNIKSEILAIMQKVYEKKFGKTPNVKVMHAGLECGIIQGAYPDMDMISFGPDLEHPHSPDERVNIASVQKVWAFLTETLENI
jgi:dipeptidase D